MFCNKCGAELADNSAFCNKCGNKLSGPSVNVNTQNKPVRSTVNINSRNSNNRKLIYIGVGIIAVLLIIVIALAAKGKGNKSNDGSNDTTISTSSESGKKNNSKLDAISGDWKHYGKVAGGSHADIYEYAEYLTIESRGVMGLGSFEAVDFETMETKGENVYFSKGLKDINIYEEDGITYYEFRAEMKGLSAKQEIGIRLYVDPEYTTSESGEAVITCDYYVAEDGYWQTHARYKQIESVQADRDSYKIK